MIIELNDFWIKNVLVYGQSFLILPKGNVNETLIGIGFYCWQT